METALDITFPTGARVACESSPRQMELQIWIFDGTLEVTVSHELHLLERGDCLAMELTQPIIGRNVPS
jgi:hypothetical protein